MSEFEEASVRAKSTNLWIGVICVVVAGGCLLVCAGLVAVGFVAPVVMRQERQAQQAARNAEQQAAAEAMAKAAAKARVAQPAAADTVEPAATRDSATPATDDAPANDNPKVEDEGIRGS